MKKFLKVFIIVLLVLGVIGVTCYFFFKKVEEKNNTTEPLATMLYSESKQNFNQSLIDMNSLVKEGSTDNRLDLIVRTNNNLDNVVKVLSSYYVAQNTQINDAQISKALNRVNSSRSLLNSMIKEYNLKVTSTSSAYFNRHTGANDFYKQACVYLINYATFANLLNSSLNVDRVSDLRFNMFEVYCNVVINAFSETNAATVGSNGLVVITNSNNINIMNAHFVINNLHIVTNVHTFEHTIITFNEFYNMSNKVAFANDLSVNVNNVSTASGTNEEIATYYFKLIYGI